MGVSAREVVSLVFSFSAAAASLYLLYKSTESKKKSDGDDKKKSHKARLSEVETMIMERGEHGTKDFRVHVLAKNGAETVAELSLWHDVPLVAPSTDKKAGETFNFICEIPKCTRKKFEVATAEGSTPIKQDEKKGVLREFKKGDIFFNYGCFPRTWEDPRHVSAETGYPGDNDPLDVCEIGLRQIKTGEIRAVKVLGVLAMIDDDETDWKIVAIDAEDRWAPELNDVEDVERLIPGTISLIREWFRTYKIPDGKPPNKFALDERCMPAAFAHKIIAETHEAWYNLVHQSGEVQDHGLFVPKKEQIAKLNGKDRDTKIVRNISNQSLKSLNSA